MKRVLIVEPSRSFAQFVKYALTRLGYDVVHIDKTDDILGKIAECMPEMILTETHMVGLNGIDLCAQLKEQRMLANIPVAVISVDGTVESRQKAHKAGCVDYLTKPVTGRAIHELMERHLPFDHKRHHMRVKLHLYVDMTIDGRKVTLKTLSFGEGGLYACTDHPPKVGTRLDIRIPLPGLKVPLVLKGEVIYTTEDCLSELPKGMGLKFIGLDSNMVTLLRHYMESYLADYLPEPGP